jgi:hypothetical protein
LEIQHTPDDGKGIFDHLGDIFGGPTGWLTAGSLFGMVLQDTWLFNGTIKDKINYPDIKINKTAKINSIGNGLFI